MEETQGGLRMTRNEILDRITTEVNIGGSDVRLLRL